MRIRRGSMGDYWVHVAFIRLYRYWSVSAIALKIETLTKWGTLAARDAVFVKFASATMAFTEERSEDNGQLMVFVTQPASFHPPHFLLSPCFVHPRNEISETPIKLLPVEELTPLVTRLFSVAQSFFRAGYSAAPLTLGTRNESDFSTHEYCGRGGT